MTSETKVVSMDEWEYLARLKEDFLSLLGQDPSLPLRDAISRIPSMIAVNGDGSNTMLPPPVMEDTSREEPPQQDQTGMPPESFWRSAVDSSAVGELSINQLQDQISSLMPDGWEPPSLVLEDARRQYLDAVGRCVELERSLDHTIEEWRSLAIRPRVIERFYLIQSIAMQFVERDLPTGVYSEATKRIMKTLQSASVPQWVAVSEFLKWSSSALAESKDPRAERIIANIQAAEIGELLSCEWDG